MRAGREWQGNPDRLQPGSYRTRREEEGAASFRGQGWMTVGTGLGLAQTVLLMSVRWVADVDGNTARFTDVMTVFRRYVDC